MGKDVLRFFSPYPPTLSGISDYSLTITKNLALENNILCIVKTAQEKDFLENQGLKAELFDESADSTGLNLFQIGNSDAHDYVFRAALKTPGIVVLHDLHLHGLIKAATLAYNEPDTYELLMRGDGPSGQLIADQTLMGDFNPFYSAFVRGYQKLVEGALCTIVHSNWAAKSVRREVANVPIRVIPHFCDGLVDPDERESCIRKTRQHFAIAEKSFVLSHFGFVTETKQVDFLIKIALLLQDRLDLHLLIAGGGSREILATQSANLAALRQKTIVDHLSDRMLNDSILASNMVSLLRYPSNGETSGIGARCLAMGRPVVCFDYFAYSDLPRDVAVHISLDTFDPEGAAETIFRAVSTPDFTKKREIAALRLAEDTMHISRITAAYNAVINSCRVGQHRLPVAG
jgi:glycosyltransferase involved in cell wall biosynthesis